jgi:hypothetical protein
VFKAICLSTLRCLDGQHKLGLLQGKIDETCLRAFRVALILYNDAASLSNDRRTHGWPFVLTLGNIPLERWNEPGGHVLLAIFPVLHAVANCTSEGFMLQLLVRTFVLCIVVSLRSLLFNFECFDFAVLYFELLFFEGCLRCGICVYYMVFHVYRG